MGNHHSRAFDEMVDEAKAMNIRVVIRGNKYFMYPPDTNIPMHLFHKGVLGEKPLRRWLDKLK